MRTLIQSRDTYHLNNEPSLRSRLNELLKINKSTVSGFVVDLDDFARTVVETRRYYTHYSHGKNSKAAKPRELINLIKPLRLLFERVLLNELKLPKKSMETIIKRQVWLGR